LASAAIALLLGSIATALYQAQFDDTKPAPSKAAQQASGEAADVPKWLVRKLGAPGGDLEIPEWATIPESGTHPFAVEDPFAGRIAFGVKGLDGIESEPFQSGRLYPAGNYEVAAYVEGLKLDVKTVVKERMGTHTWTVQLEPPAGLKPKIMDGNVVVGTVTFPAPTVQDEAGDEVKSDLAWQVKPRSDGTYDLLLTVDDTGFPEPYVLS
jgi:hypothetical protein